MTARPSEIARAAMAAHRDSKGFEATQTIRASGLEVVARIRHLPPHRLTVEYSSYRSPFLDLDELLTGNPEFTGEDLTGMSFVTDGRTTWVHDPGKAVAWHKPHRWLFDPVPGGASIGELAFLATLTKDFLLRDAGTETVRGRSTHRLGIRPKQPFHTDLVRSTRFVIRHGVIAFDEETLFPVRITLYPIPDTPVYAICGPSGALTIEYNDVRTTPPGEDLFEFTPPDGTRSFHEKDVSLDEAHSHAPFPFSVDGLLERGFAPLPGGIHLTAEQDEERGYLTALLALPGGDGPEAMLTVRAGNYLSPNMGRRRAAIADAGEPLPLGDATARLLDRSDAWSEHLPVMEKAQHHLELAWERDGVFWFLAAEGVVRDDLIELADTLVRSDAAAVPTPNDDDAA